MAYFTPVECDDGYEIIINYSDKTTAQEICQYIAETR